MRRFISTVFICIYMVSFMEGYQLFKIPVLVQHFTEHRKAEPAMSFFRFMSIHYFGKDNVYGDFQRDNQLPFRNCDSSILQVVCVEKPAISDIGIRPPSKQSKEFNSRHLINKSRLSAYDIFQPPRCA